MFRVDLLSRIGKNRHGIDNLFFVVVIILNNIIFYYTLYIHAGSG